MKKILCCFFVIISIVACKNASNQGQPVIHKDDTLKQEFFPVTSFLKGQLLQMDSLQVTPLNILVKNGKEDSVWIKSSELKPLLKDFISFEINDSNLVDFFTETKFNDESTESITLTYTPKNTIPDSITVKHWDVYINPGNGRVKRVYIVRKLVENGIPCVQQLTWLTDKSARLTTIQDKVGGKSEIVKDIKLIWGF